MHHLSAGGAPPAIRRTRRPRPSRLRTLPALARPIARTMPWATLITGCLVGTVFLAVLAHVAKTSRGPLEQGALRLTFLPVVAALAFVPRVPFRPLTQAVPVPVWVTPAGQLLLAVPVLAVTCWAQLRLIARTVPPHTLGHAPAVYPLIAQLTGWCAVTVAAAAWAGRSRYADLGGAIAAPVGLGVIALAWYAPVSARLLVGPPATMPRVAVAWSAVASAACALTCVAMRDQWHRYARAPHWLSSAIRRLRELPARREDRALGFPDAPVTWCHGDILTHPLEAASFDAVLSNATLHHLPDARPALRRLSQLVRPGGTLAVVGFARTRWRDWPWAVIAFICLGAANRLHGKWEHTAPQAWPPRDTFRQLRQAAREVIPGARIRHLLMGRYLLTWTRPPASPG